MVMQTPCRKDMEQMDLLQAFEIIVDKAKNSSLYNPQNEMFSHFGTKR